MADGVFAGPTSPTISGSTATFTGNQSNGIASGVDFSCPPVWTVHANSLTGDITPAAGVSGIKMRYQAANGSNGDWDIWGDGGNGGAGGFGGTLGIEMVYIEALGIYFPTLVVRGSSVDFSGGDYSISTSGANAHGISVTSLGGVGGNGGWATGALGLGPAFGGHGGAGGWGGPVSVASAGDITTNGTSSYGILAESLGGRGGNGGWAGGATYAVGGNGGAGGGGGSVTINSSSHIITQGESSDGIVGQSMGGAGGAGGDGGAIAGQGGGASGSGPGGTVTITNSGIIETQKEDSGGIFAQSVGGFTGSSGGGGSVIVTNSGVITTIGGSSDSIVAQSVGGGGGSASASGGIVGLGGTGSAGGDGGDGAGGNSGGAFSFGGDGKATGDGGNVRVVNSGAITTQGYGSDSIFAESLGGGGVTGGKGGNDYGVFISYGGKGNSGGDLSITNSGILKTGGTDAAGIFAQSIGGGGNGGQAYDIGLEFTSAAGGNSSVGGNGGAVDVTAQAASSITTGGTFGHGIHAVSMGGGGNGGNVLNITVGVQFSGTYSAGGRGGGGGDGNNVTVTNYGKIETHGEEAHGILAESVGGGNGGNVISWLTNVGVVSEMPAISANLILGGTAGEGGNGATVAVTNKGDIDSFGNYAYGVLAQSIGGGGGAGGNAMAGTLAINSLDFTMSLGGNGSKGGNGGLVDVENRGTIDTKGHFSYGVLAQSIGGGGGAGGNSSTLTINLDIPTDWTDFLPSPDLSATLSLGGKSGGGGSGGTVNVRNLGDISTTGEFSHGILAQSIGAGGGAGGDCTSITVEPSVNPLDYLEFLSFTSMESQLLLGARGGSGGNGGSVGVTNSGTIGTEGNFAVGILAQSIGGGGGAAGGSVFECPLSLTASFDAGSMVLGGQGGSGGNGGAVTVTNSGAITTEGGFSHGILAQSLGGGGGFAGISEQVGIDSLILGGPLGVSIDTSEFGVGFAGSLGGWGSAGNVTVTHTGSITTDGPWSDGILAQSVAKRGQTDLVTINVNGDIAANGQGSNGIHAQSLGVSNSYNGNVAVTIDGGDVQGGSGGGAGVRIDGGKSNTLMNRGGISALSGTAILAGSGNDAVHSWGTVTGSVNLGSGVNSFHNYEGATFNTGALIDLGQGNDLINAGVLAIGGSGVVGNTLLNGDLIQTDSGVIEIDVAGFEAGMFDTLDVTGAMTGGKVRFSLSGFDVMTLGLDEYESASIPFLTSDSLDGFGDALSCSYIGRVMGFQYGVYEQSGTLYLRITHGIPAPSAMLLVSVGLGVLRLRRRRGV